VRIAVCDVEAENLRSVGDRAPGLARGLGDAVREPVGAGDPHLYLGICLPLGRFVSL
jgi:hypothetical protein